jgi:CDGSH-type Zn-finger protein
MVLKDKSQSLKKVEIRDDGPYVVSGGIPLVRKIQVVSELGEPLTWKKEGDIATEGPYCLCRCGKSRNKPFCDETHCDIGFDGSEKAPINTSEQRRESFPDSSNIIIRVDLSLCTNSGFCANRETSIAEMAAHTDNTAVRALAIAMVEHCPSGSLTYALKEDEADIEVDLPQQIAVTTEITSEGAIQGPLWVTGGIPILRADGQPFEVRNRVTLCNCGHSRIKPLCDGSHRDYPTKA